MAHESRPHIVYRAASDGNSVAAWTNGRWVPIAGRILGKGDWASIYTELLVDGKPAWDQSLFGPAPRGDA